jgi:hypothetical protein
MKVFTIFNLKNLDYLELKFKITYEFRPLFYLPIFLSNSHLVIFTIF